MWDFAHLPTFLKSNFLRRISFSPRDTNENASIEERDYLWTLNMWDLYTPTHFSEII